MSIFRGQFFAGNTITLKGQFESDGTAQTPDAASAKIEIWKKGSSSAYLVETSASISGTTVFYKTSSIAIGEYVAYISAEFNSGADKRTGEIKFSVKAKSGIW